MAFNNIPFENIPFENIPFENIPFENIPFNVLFLDANFDINDPRLMKFTVFFYHGSEPERIFKMQPLSVVDLVKEGDGKLRRKFCFSGEINLRIGVAREFHSYLWIYEKSFSSKTLTSENLELDLSGIISGKLEVQIYAKKYSHIYLFSKQLDPKNEVDLQQLLYTFSFPVIGGCCEEPLYLRSDSGVLYSFEKRQVKFYRRGTLDLLTYFNAFSTCKWIKYTNLRHLSLYFDFLGRALVYLVQQNKNGRICLDSFLLNSKNRQYFVYSLQQLPEDGILGCHIWAVENSILYGGGYFTADPVVQDVKLGIGITTFKREEYVKGTVARLKNAIAAHPVYSDSIDITVVDNGRSLEPDQLPGVTLIPNRNLGGTGGFMRNLVHYQEQGKVTHVLFMDDDAFCEPSSIFRSVSFIRHAKDKALSISGAMLSENIQFMQWENGAWFDKACHPMHCDYDLRNPEVLVKNEHDMFETDSSGKENSSKTAYGAWWFFMFPLCQVSMYSFPFFVRGDDIEFSYTNNFNIARMNGICIWQEDFKIKESPLTLYLDMRSHILHHMVIRHLDHGLLQIMKMVWNFFNRFNLSYEYGIAKAIVMAFADMQEGPRYWMENMDTSEIRAKVKQNCYMNVDVKKSLRDDYKEIPEADKNIRLPFLPKTMRKYTLNGHLIPALVFSKKLTKLNIYKVPFSQRVFLRHQILVYDELNQLEFVLKCDRGRFFRNLYRMILTSLKFIIKYGRLKNEYRKFLSTLKTDEFWKQEFQKLK